MRLHALGCSWFGDDVCSCGAAEQPSPAGEGAQETLRYCRCGYVMPPVTQERSVCVIDYGECVCRPSLLPERAALVERLKQADPKWQERSEEELRRVISTLCHFIWYKQLRPGEHLWTIPVDHQRDFDIILSDAVDELIAWREAAAALRGETGEKK